MGRLPQLCGDATEAIAKTAHLKLVFPRLRIRVAICGSLFVFAFFVLRVIRFTFYKLSQVGE